MSESIFEKSTQGKLSEVFGAMTQRPASKTLVKESTNAPVEAPVEAPVATSSVGTRFDEVFQTIISESDDNYVSIEGEVDGETIDAEAYEEGEMISVPKAILSELLAYMEDTMGDEDAADFELPLEGADYNLAKNRMGNTTSTGSPKQSNKVGTSSAKTGVAADRNEARTGTVKFLKNLLACYVSTGSPKQPHKLGVNDQTVNK